MVEKQEAKDSEEKDLEEKDMVEKPEAKDLEEKEREEASQDGTKEAEKAKEDCTRLTCGGAGKVKSTTMDMENGVGGRSHNHGATVAYARSAA